ncbi:hypothetical protein GALMADRAFT_251179 [Galerina marginata CBS 339.88]|uniref:Blue (type 1) copper domain-containing protein n=1 Tax=Galerina marginata (strain CBS 339.88) TaxID=685588 RepID=A0A067SRK3_GALM3|nr:hypothetical protein GALMADRAFT_251179 [Galerina marginata CBS 339.88]
MLTKSAALFLLPALVAAQYGYAPPDTTTPSQTAAAPAVIPSAPANTAGHVNIDVGFQGNFVFNPANITANVGDLVTFYFPGTIPHSVTQSSFAAPCTYLAANATASTPGGFDSGLVMGSTFTINVTDTQPIWFHCKQVLHCGQGMVGSINAPTTGNTFDSFKSAALTIGGSETTETDNGAVTGGVHGVATAAPTSDAGTTPGSSSGTASSATKVVASASVALLSAAIAIFLA